MVKMENVSKTLIKSENKLINDIRNDKKLSENKRGDFEVLAAIFLEDFANNITKTSLDLNEEYPYGIDMWLEFLNYPVVNAYINSFKNEKMMKIADQGILDGNNQAIKLKQALADGNKSNNSNYIIVRVPEKRRFDEE